MNYYHVMVWNKKAEMIWFDLFDACSPYVAGQMFRARGLGIGGQVTVRKCDKGYDTEDDADTWQEDLEGCCW
jgi:hypothetical protein